MFRDVIDSINFVDFIWVEVFLNRNSYYWWKNKLDFKEDEGSSDRWNLQNYMYLNYHDRRNVWIRNAPNVQFYGVSWATQMVECELSVIGKYTMQLRADLLFGF